MKNTFESEAEVEANDDLEINVRAQQRVLLTVAAKGSFFSIRSPKFFGRGSVFFLIENLL